MFVSLCGHRFLCGWGTLFNIHTSHRREGALIVEEYVAGYQCKEDKSSAEWEASSRAVTEEYCSREGNGQKTLASLISKHVGEITGGMSDSKDNGVFIEICCHKEVLHVLGIYRTTQRQMPMKVTPLLQLQLPVAVAGVVVDQDKEEEQSEDASFTW
eukprot:scaffold39661_cov63-Cyclotella_meneghiniana.AAC.14